MFQVAIDMPSPGTGGEYWTPMWTTLHEASTASRIASSYKLSGDYCVMIVGYTVTIQSIVVSAGLLSLLIGPCWSPFVSSGLPWSAGLPWSLLISLCLCWSSLISAGLQRSPLISTGLQWSLLVSNGLYWSPLLSTGHWWSPVVSACLQ